MRKVRTVSGSTNAVRESSVDNDRVPGLGRVRARQDAVRSEILLAAWDLVRADGLTSLSMRDLGARVGMKAQSLYSYFPSKHAIHDAMFRQGYEAFSGALASSLGEADVDGRGPHADDAIRAALVFFDFCTADPVRYQLLFQRVIPGFEPSAESYAVALDAYRQMVDDLARRGIREQADLDLWTATLTGLVSQQLSNDPGGTRWRDLVDPAVRMLLHHTGKDRG